MSHWQLNTLSVWSCLVESKGLTVGTGSKGQCGGNYKLDMELMLQMPTALIRSLVSKIPHHFNSSSLWHQLCVNLNMAWLQREHRGVHFSWHPLHAHLILCYTVTVFGLDEVLVLGIAKYLALCNSFVTRWLLQFSVPFVDTIIESPTPFWHQLSKNCARSFLQLLTNDSHPLGQLYFFSLILPKCLTGWNVTFCNNVLMTVDLVKLKHK